MITLAPGHMRRALLIAYHFPPLAGSSGIQRTLRLVQQLPEFGWEALVLTTHPRAYVRVAEDLLADVPPHTVVRRAFALDAARHLAWRGRYFAFTARPDRWVSWRFDGVRQGMRMIREFAPEVIWSTYPFATAHLIGAELARRSRLPWIADFRDPMAQDGYPADPATWREFKRIEERAAIEAKRCVFTTPGALRTYRARYPEAAPRMALVENGYDEESFAQAAKAATRSRSGARLTLLHSGILYPQERDPTALFTALARLAGSGVLSPADLCLRFRASANDEHIAVLANRHGVGGFIELAPPVPYRDALAEMLTVDALLLMQDEGCNDQIPAKAYEYLRAGRPVLGIADHAGDTAALLRDAGIDTIAKLESAEEIEKLLPSFLAAVRAGTAPVASASAAAGASRRARTGQMAALFDAVARPFVGSGTA
ncbi:MAG: glycosyltransferase [Burkholderiales bacterium]